MTERLARISARRPWATIGVWLLLMLVMGGIGQNLLPTTTSTRKSSANGEARVAADTP